MLTTINNNNYFHLPLEVPNINLIKQKNFRKRLASVNIKDLPGKYKENFQKIRNMIQNLGDLKNNDKHMMLFLDTCMKLMYTARINIKDCNKLLQDLILLAILSQNKDVNFDETTLKIIENNLVHISNFLEQNKDILPNNINCRINFVNMAVKVCDTFFGSIPDFVKAYQKTHPHSNHASETNLLPLSDFLLTINNAKIIPDEQFQGYLSKLNSQILLKPVATELLEMLPIISDKTFIEQKKICQDNLQLITTLLKLKSIEVKAEMTDESLLEIINEIIRIKENQKEKNKFIKTASNKIKEYQETKRENTGNAKALKEIESIILYKYSDLLNLKLNEKLILPSSVDSNSEIQENRLLFFQDPALEPMNSKYLEIIFRNIIGHYVDTQNFEAGNPNHRYRDKAEYVFQKLVSDYDMRQSFNAVCNKYTQQAIADPSFDIIEILAQANQNDFSDFLNIMKLKKQFYIKRYTELESSTQKSTTIQPIKQQKNRGELSKIPVTMATVQKQPSYSSEEENDEVKPVEEVTRNSRALFQDTLLYRSQSVMLNDGPRLRANIYAREERQKRRSSLAKEYQRSSSKQPIKNNQIANEFIIKEEENKIWIQFGDKKIELLLVENSQDCYVVKDANEKTISRYKHVAVDSQGQTGIKNYGKIAFVVNSGREERIPLVTVQAKINGKKITIYMPGEKVSHKEYKKIIDKKNDINNYYAEYDNLNDILRLPTPNIDIKAQEILNNFGAKFKKTEITNESNEDNINKEEKEAFLQRNRERSPGGTSWRAKSPEGTLYSKNFQGNWNRI